MQPKETSTIEQKFETNVL